jgi:XisI protein
MDKLAKYRQIVQDVLQEYAAVPISNGDVQTQTIFNRSRTIQISIQHRSMNI